MADYDLLHDGEEIDACIDEVVAARGSEASLSARLADIVEDFEEDQQRQETEIGVVAALGAKNQFNIDATPVANHTDFTLVSGKLTVTASGNWAHYSVPLNLPAGSYILSTVISGYSKASGAPDTSMRLRMSATTSGGTNVVLQTVTGDGAISVPFTWSGGTLYLQFYSDYNGTSYANSFAAENTMIRRAEITDDSYAPYAPTNRELYETEQRQDAVIADKWGYIRGTIGGTGDFNTVVSSGYYRYNGSPANAPTGANGEFGVLMVYAAGSYISQIVHCFLSSQYGIYIRSSTNTGSTWTAWLKLEGTQAATVQSSAASLMQAGRIDADNGEAETGEEEEER